VTVRRSSPVVTLLLIAGNILAAFALLFNPELAFAFGFRPDHPSLAGAISCLFLHSNVVHLLGNMVFLAAVGVAVELAAGRIQATVASAGKPATAARSSRRWRRVRSTSSSWT
jgi:membrane associated rhomboid family serine protease